LDAHVDRLHLCQQLETRLRLACLGGLGAEALHEGGEMLTLRLLLAGETLVEGEALIALALERCVVAAIESELGAFEMQDRIGRAVEEIAVAADDDAGVRIARDGLFEPQGG